MYHIANVNIITTMTANINTHTLAHTALGVVLTALDSSTKMLYICTDMGDCLWVSKSSATKANSASYAQ